MQVRYDISPDLVRELLDYDDATGGIVWRKRTEHHFAGGKRDAGWACWNWNAKYAGTPAGGDDGGYIGIRINYRMYRAHQLAWAHFYGEWAGWPVCY